MAASEDDDDAVIFGDDEIAVVNMSDKPAYDWSRPYRLLGVNADIRARFDVAVPRRLDASRLCSCRIGGRFRAIACPPLFADGMEVTLRDVPNPVRAPPFGVAMTYATARRALDIWKVYLDWDSRFAAAIAKPMRWHFQPLQPRLEIVPFIKEGVDGGMAASGFGFVELGTGQTAAHHTMPLDDTGQAPSTDLELPVPYWLIPDVLVHELAHHLLYATVGFGPGLSPDRDGPAWSDLWRDDARPKPREAGDAFRAFHEGFADIAALLVSMHHDRFLRDLIDATRGDIFSVNALTSIGEVSRTKTIRNAMNALRLSDLAAPRPCDPPEFAYYRLSQVISGALFDILAAFALHYLAAYRVLQPELVDAWKHDPLVSAGDVPSGPMPPALPAEERLKKALAQVYDGPDGPSTIRHATLRARDGLGRLLGGYMAHRRADGFDPAAFSLAQLRDDLAMVAHGQDSSLLPGAEKAETVCACFRWRGI